MSDSENTSENTPTREGSSRKESSRGGSFTAGLALLLSLASVSASAWLFYSLAYKNAGLLSQSIPQQVENLRTEMTQLQKLNQQNSKSIEDLGKGQQVLAEATKKAYTEIGKSRNKWAISEVEQLLIIANQRLQLAHDFETAAIALQTADNRLATLADPSMTPVRKQLAAEINQLKSYERTDISGISLHLASLIDNVEKLPLSLKVTYQHETHSKTAEQNGKTAATTAEKEGKPAEQPGFFSELWSDIRGLVQVRSNVQSYKPLLAPEQQYFLRENLRLLLLGAQQGLLRNDRIVFTHNLKAARQWVDDYFDINTQAIRQLKKDIDGLLKTKMVEKEPDISKSLTLLRKLSLGPGK